MKSENKLIGTSLLTAIAASLCCMTPVLALIAGTSGIASTFSWIEPFRPYSYRTRPIEKRHSAIPKSYVIQKLRVHPER